MVSAYLLLFLSLAALFGARRSNFWLQGALAVAAIVTMLQWGLLQPNTALRLIAYSVVLGMQQAYIAWFIVMRKQDGTLRRHGGPLAIMLAALAFTNLVRIFGVSLNGAPSPNPTCWLPPGTASSCNATKPSTRPRARGEIWPRRSRDWSRKHSPQCYSSKAGRMRIFKLKGVAKFARQERITDASLIEAIERAERGSIDADLGGGLIKQRIARQGQGRSGGYRFIVAYRAHGRAVFLFGFAKNEQENISREQLSELRAIGAKLLAADTARIKKTIEDGVMTEMKYEDEKDA